MAKGREPQPSNPRGQAIPSALRKGEQTGKRGRTQEQLERKRKQVERETGEGDRGQALPPPAADCWFRRLGAGTDWVPKRVSFTPQWLAQCSSHKKHTPKLGPQLGMDEMALRELR